MPVRRSKQGFALNLYPYLAEHLERASSYTYAIWDGEAIKIGTTRGHPQQRLHALQTGNPRQLHLVAYSAVYTEAWCHQRLHKWRIRGEWFRLHIELLRFISLWCWVDSQVLQALVVLLQGK